MAQGGQISYLPLQQPPRSSLDIGLPHQAFADEEGAGAAWFEAEQVSVGVDAAFADQKGACGGEGGEAFCGCEVGDEAFEVAVVDADQAGFEVVGAGHFLFVVDFDERVHALFAGGGFDFGHLAV